MVLLHALRQKDVVAMEHTENFYNSVSRYFEALEATGFYPQDQTTDLVLYSFISGAVFDGPLYEYLDDEGLRAFSKVLGCMHRKGCLVSDISLVNLSKPTQHFGHGNLRQSEFYVLRNTEDNSLRTTE